MSPTLHHVPKTISSPIVQCLIELNLADNPVHIQEMTFPELKTESHLAVNPMGTSPAFQDGDIILWESGAVLDYLLECYDTGHTLYPACLGSNPSPGATAARAKYLHLKQYIIATVYPFIASVYIHTLKPAAEQDASYVESAQDKWKTLLGPVLTKWLGDGPYFLGEKMSAIDFLVAKPLNNVNSMGLLDAFPTLKALFVRIQSRPSFKPAYESFKDTSKSAEQPTDRSMVLVPKKEVSQ